MSNSNYGDPPQKPDSGAVKQEVSLAEELQSITAGLSGTESETEVSRGLDRLKELRARFAAHRPGRDPAAAASIKRAEELIDRAEENLKKLRRYLAHKRRIQEGQLMRKGAEQRGAGPDPLGYALAASQALHPSKAERPGSAEQPASPKDGSAPLADILADAHADAHVDAPVDAHADAHAAGAALVPSHAPEAPEANDREWSRAQRLSAHMAASFAEDPKYFDRLRKDAVRNAKRIPAPHDNSAAEVHYRAVHSLNVRLMNIEMKIRALAKAAVSNRPVAELLQSSSNEIRGFMRELKARRAERPDMAAEYDRLFGGWAERFSSMPAAKGGEILGKCLSEQRSSEAPEADADNPLVLRPDNN